MKWERFLDTAVTLSHRHDFEWTRFPECHLQIARRRLILIRMAARTTIDPLNKKREELRALRRIKNTLPNKLNAEKVSFPLLDARIELLKKEIDKERQLLVGWGEIITITLDLWQELGATLKDLCDLCSRNYEQVLKEIPEERRNEAFSSLFFIYNLDYNHKGDWIDMEKDAPFTHAVKEHILDVMLNTPHGRESAHEALEACFPEIIDSAIHKSVDYDGNEVWRDKDGEIIGGIQ